MKASKTWLYGARVILTGAGDGIGKELAKRLVNEFNCTVLGISRSEHKLVALASELGEQFSYIATDVASGEFWTKFASDCLANGTIYDLLINNAGVMPPFIPLDKTDEQTFNKTMSVNLTACYYSCHALIPVLKQSKRGAIVNVSSAAALCPLPGTAAYSASKAALKAMTTVIACEQPSLYVGYICPGFTKTNLFENKGNNIFDSKLVRMVSTSAKRMVDKFIKGIVKKRKRMVFGADAKMMQCFHKIAPKSSAPIIQGTMKMTKLPVFNELFGWEDEGDSE